MGLLDKLFTKQRDGASCSAVIAAAGSSSRMGGENKLFLPLNGVPVLVRSLMAFERAPSIKEIVVATREEDMLAIGDFCRSFGITKVTKIIKGGSTRAESVLLACMECASDCTHIAVHDGARPLVSVEVIERTVEKAKQCAAAAPAIPVKDTVKVAENGIIRSTLVRESLRAVQTPQVFDAQLLRAALQSAVEMNLPITDDCSAVEWIGKEITLTEGDEANLKITTPIDMILAEAILRERGDVFG